jgi:SAM-dependent methyltransferase
VADGVFVDDLKKKFPYQVLNSRPLVVLPRSSGGLTNADEQHHVEHHSHTPQHWARVSQAKKVIACLPYYVNLLRGLPSRVLRRISRGTWPTYSVMAPFLTDKIGLEIGGPSSIFCKGKEIPVYDHCQRIDTCNFSNHTLWDDLADYSRIVGPRCGKAYVAEACDLSIIPDETYNFVLASHVLEHVANPLRALREWKRVLKVGGALAVIVSDKRRTFNHKRPFTTIEHLESDFQANTQEDDLTHLDEILRLHDLSLDPPAGSRQLFRERCLQNSFFRAMHHHVYNPEVLSLVLRRIDMRMISLSLERPSHIVGVAQRLSGGF